MTLETFTSHAPAVTSTGVPDAVNTLRAWATTYSEVAQFVAPLVATPFVPDAFKPRVDPRASDDEKRAAYETAVASATAAVIYGAAIGFDPLTALQNVYVVGGRPGLYAAAMVAIVQAAGHEVWTEDITDSRAVVCGRRRGSQSTERVSVTIDGAKRAGWTRNAKYASEPQAMLWARAASTVCRRIAQDALKGIGASVEELQDSEAAPAAGGTRTVQRAATPAPAALPAAPVRQAAPVVPVAQQPVPHHDEPTAAPAPAGDAQIDETTWRRINAAYVTLGVTGPGQSARRLRGLSNIVGRQITAGSDLTVDEGALVLDTLTAQTRDSVRELVDVPQVTPAQQHAAQQHEQQQEGRPPLPDHGDDDQAGDVEPVEDTRPPLPTQADDPFAAGWPS